MIFMIPGFDTLVGGRGFIPALKLRWAMTEPPQERVIWRASDRLRGLSFRPERR
jgi:hypothetical protein